MFLAFLPFLVCLSLSAAVTFDESVILSDRAQVGLPMQLRVADIDGDDDLDVLVASFAPGTVYLWLNEGNGVFGDRLVAVSLDGSRSFDLGDIDADGDLDMIVATLNDKLNVYINEDGLGNFSAGSPVTPSFALDGPESVVFADVNDDGLLDVLCGTRYDETLVWYANTGGVPQFSDAQVLVTSMRTVIGIATGDLDGDNQTDICCTVPSKDKLGCFFNEGTGFSDFVEIDTPDSCQTVLIVDYDGDGSLDLVVSALLDDSVGQYLNNGTGTFSARTDVVSLRDARDVAAVDLNGDGALDLVTGSSYFNSITWSERVSNDPITYNDPVTLATKIYDLEDLEVADIDGDGLLDLVACGLDGDVVWVRNEAAANGDIPVFGDRQYLSSPTQDISFLQEADVNQDGLPDLVFLAEVPYRIGWFENLGNLNFSEPQVVYAASYIMYSMVVADVTGDELPDLIVSRANDRIFVLEALPGGMYEDPVVVTTNAADVYSLHAADLDGDDDLDIVFGSLTGNVIGWLNNTDGAGTFAPSITIGTGLKIQSIAVGDLNGDGTLDIVSVDSQRDLVAWFENDNETGAFSDEISIDNVFNVLSYVSLVDVDGDDDLDIVVMSSSEGMVSILHNLDGAATFGPAELVSSNVVRPAHVFGYDVDADGAIDLVVTGEGGAPTAMGTAGVVWFANEDGEGNWSSTPEPISSFDGATYASLLHADDNNVLEVAVCSSDGRVEVVVASNNVPLTSAPTAAPTVAPTPAPSSDSPPGSTPAPATGSADIAKCGNGVRDADEQCDASAEDLCCDETLCVPLADCDETTGQTDASTPPSTPPAGGSDPDLDDRPPSTGVDNSLVTAVVASVAAVACVVTGGVIIARRQRLVASGARHGHGNDVEMKQPRGNEAYFQPPKTPVPSVANTVASTASSTSSYHTPSTTGGGGGTTAAFSSLGVSVDFLIADDEIVRSAKIGEGAFGVVLRGSWGDKAIAIKEVKGNSKEALRQLLDEGQKLVNLPPHDNIVTFYGVCDDPAAIILQFCDGGSLVDRLYGPRASSTNALTPREREQVALGVARGLHHLHHARVIHRDVAARNVLLHDGVAKLTDMGMARENADDAGTGANYFQQTATTTGPLKWMAKEQLKDRAVSYKADVYSFGIVLFETWGQEEPWTGLSAIEAASAVLVGQRHRIPPEAPVPVAAAMVACFEPDPHERPTMRQIVAAFDASFGDAALPPVGGDGDPGTNEDVVAAVATHFSRAARTDGDDKDDGPTETGGEYIAPPKAGDSTSTSLSRKASKRRRKKEPGLFDEA